MDQLHGLGGLGAHLPVDTLDKFGQGLFVGGEVEPVPPDHVQLFRGEGLWGVQGVTIDAKYSHLRNPPP